MSNVLTINLPDFGEFDDVEVIEVCVKEGQKVDSEEPIVVLETDKAAMEIPSSVEGVVKKVLINIGDKVKIGIPFLEIEVEESHTDKKKDEPREEKESLVDNKVVIKEELPSAVDDAADVMSGYEKTIPNLNQNKKQSVHSGPATRKLAREFGIDLINVHGSGPKGRILKEDLHEYVKNILNNQSQNINVPKRPEIDFSKWGDISTKELSKFEKTSLNNLHNSWISIPHVTQHDEADVTNLLKLREKLFKKNKVKVSPLAYIVKSTAETLKDFPKMNCSLSSEMDSLIFKDFYNIGIAIDTDAGLIVPNIKEADKKSILEISSEINDLATLAKKRRLSNDHLNGTTFTISSLGGVGGKFFTPIINPPEVGILGLSKTYDALKLDKMKLQTKKQLPISLSYDHRVINGVFAVKFLNKLIQYLHDSKFLESSFK
ncbi:MAG: 2-oxo acid dehydrogenase subunit E2 [Gammaproteobacteria bacterium]